VKVKNIRPQYKDLKEWADDSDNLYIGRRGGVFINRKGHEDKEEQKRRYPLTDSPFANPFKLGKEGDRDVVIEKYRVPKGIYERKLRMEK
jgi:hypothetical protein